MFNICCPDCFSKDLQLYGFEPKHNYQKYFCKKCHRQFNQNSFAKPKSIVSDRLPSYTFPVKSVFSDINHIKVKKFSDDISNNLISNNLIEAFFSKFKAHHKAHRGLKNFNSVNSMLNAFFFFYNFIRPHGSLNNSTPARVAGVNYSELARKNLMLF